MPQDVHVGDLETHCEHVNIALLFQFFNGRSDQGEEGLPAPVSCVKHCAVWAAVHNIELGLREHTQGLLILWRVVWDNALLQLIGNVLVVQHVLLFECHYPLEPV